MKTIPGSMAADPPHILLMGQTPPPWHGQAVATQILFEHDWPGFEVRRLRMEFSEEMDEVGRFSVRKIGHLIRLIRDARRVLREHPGTVLFYPPASANWVPFFRDVVFLAFTRHLAGRTVFIYHASGLPVFVSAGWVRRWLGKRVYRDADMSLEVSQEKVPPHKVFRARAWRWCPCAIEVPAGVGDTRERGSVTEALFVGSLQEGKGVLEVLRTAAMLRDAGRRDDFRFRIVGRWFSSEFEAETLALHRELDLGGMVELVGELTGDAKWRAYARADVFFFPTHYASEATPIVIMEALGMGLAIVTTEWAGIPAMLKGAETARLLPVRSPRDYARALTEIADGAEDRALVRRRSREFYESHYQPERFIERVAASFVEEPVGPAAVAGREVLPVTAYLADQNPQLGRSLGISRMSEVVLRQLAKRDEVALTVVASRSSVEAPDHACRVRRFPWGTRSRLARVVTDHLHPYLVPGLGKGAVWYYPKGFMPRGGWRGAPSVVTIHDTIIQHYEDHYRAWRPEMEYSYWAGMLRNALLRASAIMTVSENAKRQIQDFVRRHGLPEKEIHVTYEPCLYEDVPQPEAVAKEGGYALHLGSREPHKRTEWLAELWRDWRARGVRLASGDELPVLHIVGRVSPVVEKMVRECEGMMLLPFLENAALMDQFRAARALIFPSEIEGFGLPAIEAYFLGTPVCHHLGTSVEEVLKVATDRGKFDLDHPETLLAALDEVLRMPPEEVRDCGLTLREAYSSEKVVGRMVEVFRDVAARQEGSGVLRAPERWRRAPSASGK